jgi:hypothetical protein
VLGVSDCSHEYFLALGLGLLLICPLTVIRFSVTSHKNMLIIDRIKSFV